MTDDALAMSPEQWRLEIGSRLATRRGARSKHSINRSGVGYNIVHRLELGRNHSVSLDHLFMLSRFYGCGLAGLVDPFHDVTGAWPQHHPSWPDTDVYVRRALRQRRMEQGIGAKLLAKEAGFGIHPSWVFRIESGECATLDVVRLAAVAAALECSTSQLLPDVFQGEANGA